MLSPQTLIHDTATTPQLQSIEGVPTRIDVAFTNKDGVEKRGIRKETEKMLKSCRRRCSVCSRPMSSWFTWPAPALP